jgi:hypothetical protein
MSRKSSSFHPLQNNSTPGEEFPWNVSEREEITRNTEVGGEATLDTQAYTQSPVGNRSASEVRSSMGSGSLNASHSQNSQQNYPWEEIPLKGNKGESIPSDSILHSGFEYQGESRSSAPENTARGKNWPSFYPIIRHDIYSDIPAIGKKHAETSYLLWKLLIILYLFNLIAIISFMASGKEGYTGVGGLLLAIGYLVLFPPFTFFFWHFPLYHAIKGNRTILFFTFFLMFFIQICQCIFLGVGISDGGGGGILSCIGMFKDKFVAQGILSLVCICYIIVWVIMAWRHIYQVGILYRYGGHSLDTAKKEALASAAHNRAIQKTAINAAMNSV